MLLVIIITNRGRIEHGIVVLKRIWVLISIITLMLTQPAAAGGNTEEESIQNNNEVNKAMKDILNIRLTSEEFQIIELKGTETPFSGEYDKLFADGIYTCRRCSAPLYNSSSKFDSGCGWPAFDDEIKGAITRKVDGSRTEIICSTCNAHLGHVFTGEKLTDKNIRHCVNSLSMRFVPADKETGRAVFAGGCFWGVEYFFNKTEGVLSAVSGYTGGHKMYPTYEEVSSTDTGHVEAVEILYDPELVNYETLARLFFEIHDPTQDDGQGPDIGSRYLSVIFYENLMQKNTIINLIELLKKNDFDVKTELKQAAAFWPAEDYHQDYYTKKGTLPYCHGYIKRF